MRASFHIYEDVDLPHTQIKFSVALHLINVCPIQNEGGLDMMARPRLVNDRSSYRALASYWGLGY